MPICALGRGEIKAVVTAASEGGTIPHFSSLPRIMQTKLVVVSVHSKSLLALGINSPS
jgi:hypothetical protein